MNQVSVNDLLYLLDVVNGVCIALLLFSAVIWIYLLSLMLQDTKPSWRCWVNVKARTPVTVMTSRTVDAPPDYTITRRSCSSGLRSWAAHLRTFLLLPF